MCGGFVSDWINSVRRGDSVERKAPRDQAKKELLDLLGGIICARCQCSTETLANESKEERAFGVVCFF
jgi:hypothetical protein